MASVPTPSGNGIDGDGIDYSDDFVTEQIFDSYEEACSWCKQVAIGLRFELVISSKKSYRDGRIVGYLKCNRGLKYRGKDRDLASAPRPNAKTKACECRFMIKVVEIEGSKFQISPVFGLHNHQMIVNGEGHRQMSVLTPPMKEMIREMSTNQSKPRKILLGVKEAFAGSTPNIKQIYNERSKIKK